MINVAKLVQDHRILKSYIKLNTLIIEVDSESADDYNEDYYDYLIDMKNDYTWNDNILMIALEEI